METVICYEEGCENTINPETMIYAKDYYVLINLTTADQGITASEMIDDELVGIFCKNCGIIQLAEAQANGYEVISRRAG